MRQFFSILSFEFTAYLKNKVFVGVTLALVVIIGVVLSFPSVAGMFGNVMGNGVGGIGADASQQDGSGANGGESKGIILFSDKTAEDEAASMAFFAEQMKDMTFERTDATVESIRPMLEDEKYECAVIITGPTTYTYVVPSVGMYDRRQGRLDDVLLEKYRSEEFLKLGLTPEQSGELMNAKITSDVINTGKDQMQTFFYTYILIFALYMAVLLYGQMVATGVASEKSSRAMEMLITSAKPTNLIFGKVIGSGLAGLSQMTAVLAAAFIFFNLNKAQWGDSEIVNSIFNVPLPILLYTILFFVLGYFIYAFLYGAIGSLASKVEDINTSSMPIILIFVAAFIIVMFSMTSGQVDSLLMIVASYVPLTSPMAMFVRIAMGEVAWFEIVISVAILLVSTVGIGVLSAKIYKVGVLMYGKPPKLTTVLKAIK